VEMKLYGGTLNPHQKWWGFFVLGDTEKERDGTGGILSGKRVYDTYCSRGKSRQNLNPRRQVKFMWNFFYVNGCG